MMCPRGVHLHDAGKAGRWGDYVGRASWRRKHLRQEKRERDEEQRPAGGVQGTGAAGLSRVPWML